MAEIILEIRKLIKGLTKETSRIMLIAHRIKTIRHILSAIDYRLQTYEMDNMPPDKLCILEARLHELRPVFLRLECSANANDLEKLINFAQTREELPSLDAAVARLRYDVDFLGLLDASSPHHRHFSEEQREEDVARDQKDLVKFIVNLFPYRREKLGTTPEQIAATDALADAIHQNDVLRYKPGAFLQKIEEKVKLAAEATVDVLDAIYLENNINVQSFTPIVSNNPEEELRKSAKRRTVRNMHQLTGSRNTKLKVLGKGSYGDVLAHNWQGQRVALKPLPLHKDLSLSAKAELRNETKLWKEGLKHKNLEQFFGFLVRDNKWYMIVEECDTTLYSLLHEQGPRPKVLDELARDYIFEGIASGLCYLHDNNFLHRNLKPTNVLIGGNARSMVKLGNFGLQQLKEEVPGTPPNRNTRYLLYMAPEVHPGNSIRRWSGAADVYSLGIILWEMTQIDVFPFEGEADITKAVCEDGVRPEFDHNQGSEWLRKLARSCWAKEVFDRPRSKILLSLVEEYNRHKPKATTPEEAIATLLREHSPGAPTIMELSKPKVPTKLVDRLVSDLKNEEFVRNALGVLVEASKQKGKKKQREFQELVRFSDPLSLLLQIMYNFPKNHVIQANACNLLRSVIIVGQKELTDEFLKAIAEKTVLAMSFHQEERVVQFFAVLLLGTLAQRGTALFKASAFNYNIPDVLLQTMRNHPEIEPLNRYCCWTIGIFLLDSDLRMKREWLTVGMPNVLMEAMAFHTKSEDVQIYAMGVFVNLVNKSKEMVTELFALRAYVSILAAMSDHPTAAKLQEYGCVLVAQFSQKPAHVSELLDAGGVETLFKIVQMSTNVQHLHHKAWHALRGLCSSKDCLAHVINAMSHESDDYGPVIIGCMVIKHLGKTIENKDKFVDSGCLSVVLNVMAKYKLVPQVCEKACNALVAIAVTPSVVMALVQAGGIETVVQVLQQNGKDTSVQEAGLGVLAALIDCPVMQENGLFIPTKRSPGPLYKRNAIQSRNAASIIMYAMLENMHSDAVVTKGLWILSELALWVECGDESLQVESTSRELIDLDIAEVLEFSFNQHTNNVTVQRLALECVTRLVYNDTGRRYFLSRPFGYLNYATDSITNYGDFPEVVTAASMLLGRLALCATCKREHYQYNEYLGAKKHGETFLWNNEDHTTMCTSRCVALIPPRTIDTIINALTLRGHNFPPFRKAASYALRAFSIGSPVAYGRIVELVLNEDSLAEYLPWFDIEEAWEFWEKIPDEHRVINKRTLGKRRGKLKRGKSVANLMRTVSMSSKSLQRPKSMRVGSRKTLRKKNENNQSSRSFGVSSNQDMDRSQELNRSGEFSKKDLNRTQSFSERKLERTKSGRSRSLIIPQSTIERRNGTGHARNAHENVRGFGPVGGPANERPRSVAMPKPPPPPQWTKPKH